MRRFNIIKHESVLVLKFLYSMDDKWEHHVYFLKNSEKIKTMDLKSLYGNLYNFEETNILQKEIMKGSLNEIPSNLFSRKSSFIPESDANKSDNAYSKEEYYADLLSSATMIVKHYGKFD